MIPRVPPLVLVSFVTGGLAMMGIGAFLFGLDDPVGWLLVGVGAFDVALAALLFVRSQNPPTT